MLVTPQFLSVCGTCLLSMFLLVLYIQFLTSLSCYLPCPGNELFHIWCQLGDIPGYWYSYKCWFSEMCEMCGPDSDLFIPKESNTSSFSWVTLDL